MGNADNTPMAPGTFSAVGVGPIWRRFMAEAHGYLKIKPTKFEPPKAAVYLSCGWRKEIFRVDTPTVKAGACRGPSGRSGATASPAPRGPTFPTATPSPAPGTATPKPTAAPTAVPTAAPTATPPSVFYYTTQAGDTVASVAAMFNVKPQELALLNGISVDTVLMPGTVLVIPGGGGG
jgi:membrane peptidoglycan carboxypeptidase